jgi:hypothetical protein
MNKNEALEWIKGSRSMVNMVPKTRYTPGQRESSKLMPTLCKSSKIQADQNRIAQEVVTHEETARIL